MICYSIKENNFTYCLFLSEFFCHAAVEIRMDLCRFPVDAVQELFSNPDRRATMIATYRISHPSKESEAVEMLSAAILAGADMVDIDIDFPEQSKKWLINLAMNKGCKVILSYHNTTDADTTSHLHEIAKTAFTQGADITKIVTTARKKEDGEIVNSLYDYFPADKLVAFAMGDKGKWTRSASFSLGAPLVYMASRRYGVTAPGQHVLFEFREEKEILLRGEAQIPASKSMAQRAILLAALCDGPTTLYNFSLCEDTQSALSVAYQLGADIDAKKESVTIYGHQDIPNKGLIVKNDVLFVGESGLLARLCIPLASLSKTPVTIIGEKTLLLRSVNEHHAELRKLGLKITYTDKKYLPVTVSGSINNTSVTLKGKYGSQMISGLMIAMSLNRCCGTIQVDDPTSEPYLDMTSEIASYFGIEGLDYKESETPDGEYYRRIYPLRPAQKVKPVRGLEIEKDWSAAALILAAGAIMGDITLSGLPFDTIQADAEFVNVMDHCGVDYVMDDAKKTINVRKSLICPFYYDITNAPDLFAPLFLLALRADGECCIDGINRLKNKESDRAKTFCRQFSNLGVDVRIEGECMLINGNGSLTLRGGKCLSYGDHRLAMALVLASFISKKKIVIDDLECINKSFPGFMEIIEDLKTQKKRGIGRKKGDEKGSK